MGQGRGLAIEDFPGQGFLQGIARPDSFLVAQVGRTVNPHKGLQAVFLHSFAFVIQEAQIVLGGPLVNLIKLSQHFPCPQFVTKMFHKNITKKILKVFHA